MIEAIRRQRSRRYTRRDPRQYTVSDRGDTRAAIEAIHEQRSRRYTSRDPRQYTVSDRGRDRGDTRAEIRGDTQSEIEAIRIIILCTLTRYTSLQGGVIGEIYKGRGLRLSRSGAHALLSRYMRYYSIIYRQFSTADCTLYTRLDLTSLSPGREANKRSD